MREGLVCAVMYMVQPEPETHFGSGQNWHRKVMVNRESTIRSGFWFCDVLCLCVFVCFRTRVSCVELFGGHLISGVACPWPGFSRQHGTV